MILIWKENKKSELQIIMFWGWREWKERESWLEVPEIGH